MGGDKDTLRDEYPEDLIRSGVRGKYAKRYRQDGAFIAEWKQFGRPSGVTIRNQMIYVADSESNGVALHPGWKRGIRIGSLKDGKVLYRIPDPLEMKGTSAAEGVAVDAKGNVYGGEVGPRQLVKHIRGGPAERLGPAR